MNNKKLINDNNIDNRDLQSFEYEKTAISDGNIIGTCELGTATIQLLNNNNSYSEVKGTWINTIHGSFYVTKVEPVQEKVNIKLECYDIKYKLDTPFDKNGYTFPYTLLSFRNQIFDNLNLIYDDTPFPNSDMVLNEMPYFDDGITNRQVISIIAQAGGCWVDTDSSDKFYFNYFSEKTYPVNDYQELTTESTLSNPVNTIVLGRGDTEDNVYYPKTINEERVSFRIDNNYILDPQDINESDNRDVNIIPLYNKIVGTKYLVFSMKTNTMENKLELKLGDKVKYKDIYGNVIIAPIMRKKITFLGGDASKDDNYSLEISAEEIKETSTDYSKGTSVIDKLKRTEILVDKQSQDIKLINESIEENNSKLASIEITTNDITSTVSNIKTTVEENVELLKLDLDKNNIIIQTDSGNKPIETMDYDINYSVYFLKEKINLLPTTENSYEGITLEINQDYIRFKVNKDNSISNLDNKYIFNFNYEYEGSTYSLTKTIMVSLLTISDSVVTSETEPSNKKILWYDSNTDTLKRCDGEQWIVVNDYSGDIALINTSISNLATQDQMRDLESIITDKTEELRSEFIQKDDSFTMQFDKLKEEIIQENGDIRENVENITKYIDFKDGNIILGEKGSGKNKLKIEQNRITMTCNGNSVSTWEQDAFDVKRIRLGNFILEPRSNDSLSIRMVKK